ncbi:MAG TPA: hypothetical protein VH765_00635 [Xanthobacteraceae bacterium]|jgi:hypothetical protein
MCDYSLHGVASRPAKVGDRLISTRFPTSFTRGFAAVEARDIAVCLAPGTEVAFDSDVEMDAGFGFLPNKRIGERVARFRQINQERMNLHHDALEFPNGQVVLLTRLAEGQTATVLQLPASTRSAQKREEHAIEEIQI